MQTTRDPKFARLVKKLEGNRHAMHLITEIGAGRSRVFALHALPFGWPFLAAQGLATRVEGTDRAALTDLGRELVQAMQGAKLPAMPADTAPDWKAVAAIALEGGWSNEPDANAREIVDFLIRYRGHVIPESRSKMIDTLIALGRHALAAVVVQVLRTNEAIDAGEVCVRAELAKQGLRRAVSGESGWFVVVQVGAVSVKVWATDAA